MKIRDIVVMLEKDVGHWRAHAGVIGNSSIRIRVALLRLRASREKTWLLELCIACSNKPV
jgi:hypothetical protein